LTPERGQDDDCCFDSLVPSLGIKVWGERGQLRRRDRRNFARGSLDDTEGAEWAKEL